MALRMVKPTLTRSESQEIVRALNAAIIRTLATMQTEEWDNNPDVQAIGRAEVDRLRTARRVMLEAIESSDNA